MRLPRLVRWRSALLRSRKAEAGQLRALENTLDRMADRVARAELEAERRLALARRCEARALAAEDALIRLQSSLDQLRRSNAS